MLGLFRPLGALGLFAVNAMAVISCWQVLLADGFEAALGQHVRWGATFVVLIEISAGPLSLGQLLGRRESKLAMMPAAA